MKSLRLVPGPGMTAVARDDEERIETAVVEREARQHVAHLRLLAKQLPLWSDEQAARMLNRLADTYERKFEPERVA